jgi:GPH family glycoside/pentoside/hexuronide:cation symporter
MKTNIVSKVKNINYFFYGLLGLPLAMVALPVYVQIPAYYTQQLGLPLASTGLILFFARLIDTVQDPILGQLIARFRTSMKIWFSAGALLLVAAFYGLWLPPEALISHQSGLLVWLALMLIFAYTAHSMLNIAYLSWGAKIEVQNPNSNSLDNDLLKVSAWREGLGLLGVVVASILPSWILLGSSSQIQSNLQSYVWIFAVVVLVSIIALFIGAPKWTMPTIKKPFEYISISKSLKTALQDTSFRRLVPIYFINSLSVSIPATLVLFFINDQIKAPEYTGHFLAAYFIAGAIGLPIWLKLAKKIGSKKAWQLGMLIAVCSFIGAAFLGANDVNAFMVVCIASGLALGADLALPPVLLAKLIDKEKEASSYFGVWTLLSKLALAMAGLSLPILSLFGYQVGSTESVLNISAATTSQFGLTFTYALLPCFFKLIALRLLHRYPS